MSDLKHYQDLHYTMVLRVEDDGVVVASIAELPGCIAHGSTPLEALESLREMQLAWIEEALSAGLPIPEPESQEKGYSGKWVQRVTKSLHRRLSEMAKEEGTSLNQLVLAMLSEAVVVRRLSKDASRRADMWLEPPSKLNWRWDDASRHESTRYAETLKHEKFDDIAVLENEHDHLSRSR